VDSQRLDEILERFAEVRLLVFGDFFLDQYLVVEPGLAEISVETGLEADQVVEIRRNPGAAGTVCSNLAALGIRTEAMGIVGDDGEAFELLRGLQNRGVGTTLMLRSPERVTPTYIKPMRRRQDGAEDEMGRMDIKNRTTTPPELERRLIANLKSVVESFDGFFISDQVEERECGVVTAATRSAFSRLARRDPGKVFLADSRSRIAEFRGVMIKPNQAEAARALGDSGGDKWGILRRLFGIARRPVFLTCGEEGIFGFDGGSGFHCPAVPVSGPLDIVGAGDSAGAGIAAALCAGATARESAAIGNLIASVTVRKLGTTGVASREEVRRARLAAV
jgi:rfaE bifunctional protein kinase chain/domain